MVWNDEHIFRWAQAGGVTPFDPACVNPASLDLKLGNTIRPAHEMWYHTTEWRMQRHIIDGTIADWPQWGEAIEFDVFWLLPRRFVLCHSLEYVRIPDDCIALLFSKSSTGRIGLEHLHSGVADPKWEGQWTWELHNVSPWPIKLEAGKRYMQMIMMQMIAEPLVGYDKIGRYNGQTGPTPVRPERKD